MKEYKIGTTKEIEQIINVDNVECFKTDICSWIDMLLIIKEARKALGNNFSIESNEYFHWIDDGKNEANINVVIK